MDDNQPVTRYEFLRETSRLDKAVGRAHERVDGLAKDTVPVDAYNRGIADLQRDQAEYEARSRETRAQDRADIDRRFAAVETGCKERHGTALAAIEDIKSNSRFSRQQIVAIVAIAATIAAAFIGVLLTSGGAHK